MFGRQMLGKVSMSARDQLKEIRGRYIGRLELATEILKDTEAGTIDYAQAEKQLRDLVDEQSSEQGADLLQRVYQQAAAQMLESVATVVNAEVVRQKLRRQGLRQQHAASQILSHLWEEATKDYDDAAQKINQGRLDP
jgi:hypothetical protein